MISQRYDLDANALYITLLAGRRSAATEDIDPGTLVDLDENGEVIGIEVINPSRPWPLEDILDRFPISDSDARQLRAFFPLAPQSVRSRHADTALKVAV